MILLTSEKTQESRKAGIASSQRKNTVSRLWRAAGASVASTGYEPELVNGGHGFAGRDPPETDPDELRDREQETEEDGEARSSQVVGDDDVDGVRRSLTCGRGSQL